MKRKKLAKCNCSENRAVFESFAKSSAIKKGITYNFDFKCCTDSQCSYLDPITNALWDGWKLANETILTLDTLVNIPNFYINVNLRHDINIWNDTFGPTYDSIRCSDGSKLNCDDLKSFIKALEGYKVPPASILEIVKDLIK